MTTVSVTSDSQQEKDSSALKRSTSIKRLASLNLKEQQSCEARTRLIESQRKYMEAQLSKEADEMKNQLLRLQGEKRHSLRPNGE